MQRRAFITLVGIGGVAAMQTAPPGSVRAQSSVKRPLVAVLGGVTRKEFPASFMEGMRELGYVEGNNIDLAYRFADGQMDLMPLLAQELVQLNPKVIVAAVTHGAVVAKKITSSIPIVCPILNEPIELGLIAGMSRPEVTSLV